MQRTFHISETARQLDVTAAYLRSLETNGRIPPVRCDFNGRIYTESDITPLRKMGVGCRPRKLKRAEEILGTGG
jgi:DNA-binding transcriptional MerR regulator